MSEVRINLINCARCVHRYYYHRTFNYFYLKLPAALRLIIITTKFLLTSHAAAMYVCAHVTDCALLDDMTRRDIILGTSTALIQYG